MKKAMKKDTIIIADDTDILVLAVHYLEELNPPKTYICSGHLPIPVLT